MLSGLFTLMVTVIEAVFFFTLLSVKSVVTLDKSFLMFSILSLYFFIKKLIAKGAFFITKSTKLVAINTYSIENIFFAPSFPPEFSLPFILLIISIVIILDFKASIIFAPPVVDCGIIAGFIITT